MGFGVDTLRQSWSVKHLYTSIRGLRFSVDAYAIGRHLSGNEVYIRNLLNGCAALDQSSDFIADLTSDIVDKPNAVPARMQRRTVSANPFIRLGFDLTRLVYRDAPDLLHVQ